MADRIQLRRDLAATWATVNPILAQGEPGFETDTERFKFGDGTHHWNVLPYATGAFPASLELFLAWEQSYPTNYHTFSYAVGVLTDIDIYADNTLAVHIFNKHFTYTLGVLTQIVVTRISDGSTETKNFTYTLGSLTSIQVTQV